uniref:Uncharacterized protein n=1 Tax=Mycena chlorophos TaxID=658473 RepID=A0ABQ0LLR7_MYCCL|nr:predicted protein [Mycena chlorophos]
MKIVPLFSISHLGSRDWRLRQPQLASVHTLAATYSGSFCFPSRARRAAARRPSWHVWQIAYAQIHQCCRTTRGPAVLSAHIQTSWFDHTGLPHTIQQSIDVPQPRRTKRRARSAVLCPPSLLATNTSRSEMLALVGSANRDRVGASWHAPKKFIRTERTLDNQSILKLRLIQNHFPLRAPASFARATRTLFEAPLQAVAPQAPKSSPLPALARTPARFEFTALPLQANTDATY